jgi:hypothetical protein
MTRITDLTTANTATITDLIVPVVNISSSTTGITEKLSVSQLVELSLGAQGITGYMGSRGSVGYTGSAGAGGIAGSTGYTGSSGAAAAIGYSGSTGVVFQRTTAPSSSVGDTGDRKGDIAYDNTYFYYCTANYTGSVHIWKRIQWTGSTW